MENKLKEKIDLEDLIDRLSFRVDHMEHMFNTYIKDLFKIVDEQENRIKELERKPNGI